MLLDSPLDPTSRRPAEKCAASVHSPADAAQSPTFTERLSGIAGRVGIVAGGFALAWMLGRTLAWMLEA